MSARLPDPNATYAALRRKTAPGVLVERAAREPDAVAYRAKHLGIYRERTWRDFERLVARAMAGLEALGLASGERVAIMGDACEEWVISDLAAQAAGAITFGVYPTASVAEVEYQLRDAGASIFVAENQEYVDKVLPLLERLPGLRWVIVVDTTAMFMYAHPKLKPFAEVLDAADADHAVSDLRAAARALDPAAPAFIVYTSGTTGHPKGALVAHGKHLAGAYNIVAQYPQLARDRQTTVVFLPLCHVLGRDIAITLPLVSGLVPHFGESLAELPLTLFEVAPTVLFAVPRYLQKFASQVLVALHDAPPVKRAVYRLALAVGRAHARRRWEGGVGAFEGFVYRVLHWLAFRPILNKLGFDRLTLVVSGGAPLSPETMALWQIYGVNLVEMYGQTETAGAIITGQPGPFPRPGNVGTVPPGWEVRLSPAGEIEVRGADLFEGYWGKPDATREVIGDDGWLRTGDVGEWVAGTADASARVADHADGAILRIVDRARDFIVTTGGKTLSPTAIENALRSSPYVSEAIIFGHNRNYVTALIEIDYDTVSDWARAHDIAYTGFTSLAQHPAIERLLREEIGRANAALARVEQVKAFRILPKVLDPEEEGEPVTPTRKVKRQQMYERFRELVESMYGDAHERLVAEGVGDVLQPSAAGA
jgi:long-chain acyl-CoA synthetase